MRFVYWFCIPVAMVLILSPKLAGAGSTRYPSSQYRPSQTRELDVQAFLDGQPGVLKSYSDDGKLAATLIEDNSLYYSLNSYLYLALLETVHALLSDPNPPSASLRQPFGAAGPDGFAAQLDWASRELRAGLGPYNGPPVLQFTDGTQVTLSLDQDPQWIAVQRFLSIGRTKAEWQALVNRFEQAVQATFADELAGLFDTPAPPDQPGSEREDIWEATPGGGFLHLPWPEGTNMFHLAYFDHVYPTVDSGSDMNDVVYTYLGESDVQYNTHDGHDFSFPDRLVGTPILAAAPGIAYARTHRGNGVVIRHEDGYETVYWHLDSFAFRFQGLIDSNQGIWVDAGEVLGTSGSSGFTAGTPHLHFEVRHHGRQVDPYSWYSFGPDPCAAYAACEASPWLWHESLRGLYDFTPPGETAPPRDSSEERDAPAVQMSPGASQQGASGGTSQGAVSPGGQQRSPPPAPSTLSANGADGQLQAVSPDAWTGDDRQASPDPSPDPSPEPAPALDAGAFSYDRTPPLGTLSINPPADLGLYVSFDGHVLQQVGSGFPALSGAAVFEAGYSGQSVRLSPEGGLTYPISRNVSLEAGTISLWVYVPASYPASGIKRHYVFAASAHSEDLEDGIYTGTLALRRDTLGPDGKPHWNFWTTPQAGETGRDDLIAPDRLESGWHHMAVTWDAEQRSKSLYFDGRLAASAADVTLPEDAGAVLQLGRFTYDSSQSGMLFDELAIFARALSAEEIERLSRAVSPAQVSATFSQSRTIVLDINASDAESGIIRIQPGYDGEFLEPGDYYDGLEWQLPPQEGAHTLSVRYFDRAGNYTTAAQTVTLDLPPRGTAVLSSATALSATLALSATDMQQPVSMQIGLDPDFAQVPWQDFQPVVTWFWSTDPLVEWLWRGVLRYSQQRTSPALFAEVPPLYVRFRDAGGQISDPIRVQVPRARLYLPLIRSYGAHPDMLRRRP